MWFGKTTDPGMMLCARVCILASLAGSIWTPRHRRVDSVWHPSQGYLHPTLSLCWNHPLSSLLVTYRAFRLSRRRLTSGFHPSNKLYDDRVLTRYTCIGPHKYYQSQIYYESPWLIFSDGNFAQLHFAWRKFPSPSSQSTSVDMTTPAVHRAAR